MSHIHDVIDTDVHYKIDGVSRTITNINEIKRMLVQNDHNSERLTFEMPRHFDGHDFSKCNVVQVHYQNSDVHETNKSVGIYQVDDLHVSSDNDETVILSWLVSSNATKYVGTLDFAIRFACIENDGTVKYAWSTTTFKGIEIKSSIYNSDDIVDENPDILANHAQRLNELELQNPVLCTEQNLTPEEQAQARRNIGVIGESGVDPYVIELVYVGEELRIKSTCNFVWGDMLEAISTGLPIVCRDYTTGSEYVLSSINYISGQAIFVSVGEYGVWTIIISANGSVSERPYSEFGGTGGDSEGLDEIKAEMENTVSFKKNKTFRVGENLLTDNNATTTGWTGNMADGFTHSSGNTNPLIFNIDARDGDKYLISANIDAESEFAIHLMIGDSYPSDPYGTNPFVWGVQAVGEGSLSFKIEPMASTWTGTLKSLKCQKVTDDGEYEVTVPLGNLTHHYEIFNRDETSNTEGMPNHLAGFWDIQMGEGALGASVNTTRCLGIGYNSLSSLRTGGRNIGLGTFSLPYLLYGENNIGIGADSGFMVTKAVDCIVIGKAAMSYGKDLHDNIAIGASALYGEGDKAGTNWTDENNNVEKHNSTAHSNVAIGSFAGYKNCMHNNVFIGHRAGYHNDNWGSVLIGSGVGADSTMKTNGSRLVVIGQNARVVSDKDSTTVIGYGAQAKWSGCTAIGSTSIAEHQNSTVIGLGAVTTKNNQVMLGKSYIPNPASGQTNNNATKETVANGDFIVCDTVGVKRKLVFNDDGTVTWVEVTA